MALLQSHSGIHVTSTWWCVLAPLHIGALPVKITMTILALLSERARWHEAVIAQVSQKEGVVIVILAFLQLVQFVVQHTTTVHD